MEYVLPIAALLLILANGLLFYFSRKKETPSVVDEMTDQENVTEM